MTWETQKTSASYTPAVYLEPGKPPRRCNVQAIRLDSPEAAQAKLATGKAAWVSVEDAERMSDAAAGR